MKLFAPLNYVIHNAYKSNMTTTFKEIAENFNEQNIEVLEKGIWHLQSVYRIFKESELK